MIQRFVKKLPGILQTEVQKEFYSATFDQLFNPANVEQAQGFIGRRSSELLNPLTDNYLDEPNKLRAAYQLEPISFAVNAALADSNQVFYEDLLNYIEHRGGNTLNHDRLFADLYYSFAPPIDYDKFLNYQNYLWLEDGGPIVFIEARGITDLPGGDVVFDTFIKDNIIGAVSVNTSTLTNFAPSLTPTNFELSSGMRVQFVESLSFDTPLWIEGVGRSIRLVDNRSNLLVNSFTPPEDATIQGFDGLFDSPLGTPGRLPTPDHTIEDYITIERGSCEGSPWARTNRWMHEDAVDTITTLGQILGGTVRVGFEGTGYSIGDIVSVNIGDGVNGSFIITGVSLGNVTSIAVNTRGQGFSFALVDQTGVPSSIVPLNWDTSPFGDGSIWDDDTAPFRTIQGQDETDFDGAGLNGTFVGGTGYVVGEVLTMSDGTVITVDAEVGNVITEFTITQRSSALFTTGTTHTVISSTLAGNDDFTLTTAPDNETGALFWDDGTLTAGAGSGLIIDVDLATAVSRTNKGTRPIIEFKRDLELFNYGNRHIGEVNVVAATEAFVDIHLQPAGTKVDGITLVNNMRIIFLNPSTVPLIFDWDDEFPPAPPENNAEDWDDSPWELEGALGALTRFVWQVDLVSNPGVIELIRVNLLNGVTGDTIPTAEEGSVVLVTQGDIFQTESFHHALDSNTLEFSWIQAQQKGQRNKQPLFELHDTNGIRLSDTLEYPSSDFTGNELFSYKILTQERLNELGGSLLVNDPILGFPVETKGLRQLDDIIFENDIEVTRYNFTPAGSSSTEINGYYFFKVFDTLPLDCSILGSSFETNWKSNDEEEKQRIIDRYLTTSDEEDTFAISGVPVIRETGVACLVVTQGRRLNSDEFIFLAATQEVQLLAKPTVIQVVPPVPLEPTYTFTDITADLFVFLNDVFQVEDTDYIKTGENVITFSTVPLTADIIKGTQQESGAPGINEVVEIFTFTFDDIEDSDLGYFEIPNELENNPNNLEITEHSWNEFTPHFISIITEQDRYLGTAFGSGNNYRDTLKNGSLGDKILQNQSPLLKTMFVTSADELDVIEALRLSSEEYTRFRNKFIKTAKQLIDEGFTDFNFGDQIPTAQWIDEIIRRVTRAREFGDAFKDTYMIAWNNVFTEQTTIVSGAQPSVTLTDFIDLEDDKRNTLYVYIGEALQQIDTDYDIINFNPIQIRFTGTLPGNTSVITRLYEDSAPAFIPATPSKLGMFPVFQPEIVTDNTYAVPVEVLIGHDGSKTPLFGDQTDVLLLELETRIYNNILTKFRVDYVPPLEIDTFKPGKFRTTRWPLDQFNDLIKQSFFKWAASNKADYITNLYFDAADPYTWNYNDITDVDGTILSGYWRNIFDFYYDTQSPDTTPWEMLGFQVQPTWWEEQYGAAPYLPANTMWDDLETGTKLGPIGSIAVVDERYIRIDLRAKYLPVDLTGTVKTSPLLAIDTTSSLIDPTTAQAQEDYTWSDLAPVEYAWKTSESYPFAVMEALFLARPAEFGEQLWDPEHNFRIPIELTQIVNDDNDLRKRTGNSSLVVHGETVDDIPQIQTGYQVWISNRLRALKKDLTVDFGDLLRSLDVKLGHKMASFTDKDSLRIFVEGISVSSQATNLLIPQENIDVSLFTSPPVQEYVYSGILIKALSNTEYQVFGYDILAGEFEFFPPVPGAGDQGFTVGGKPATFTQFTTGLNYIQGDLVRLNGIFYVALISHQAIKFEEDNWKKLSKLPIQGGVSVTHRKNFSDSKLAISYGEKFSSVQEIFDFIIGYGEAQEQAGWSFTTVNTANNTISNWLQSAKDFLFWVGTQWEADSVIMLSPSAEKVVLNANEGYPGNVEKVINGTYSILDKNGVVIDPINTTIRREDRQLTITPNIEQTGIYGLRALTRETENIITFDNVTAFNDIIYDPLLGSRLGRVDFTGRRTLEWTGKLEAAGFIITADGLLPNYENLVNSIRNYHNTEELLDNPVIEDVAQHLIGFEERDYFTSLGIFDDAAFQFYQGLVREKGTSRAIEKLERNRLVTDINSELILIEEWALRIDSFGGVCVNQFVEFKIAASEVKVDPQLVQLSYPASQDQIALTYVFNSVDDVTLVDDTITIVDHGYRTGEPKVYSDGGGTQIGGLVSGVVYYVVVLTDDTFSLALSKSDAIAATPLIINLTAGGAGTAHTLTPHSTGTVDAITVISATIIWPSPPLVFIINHPDDTTGSGATAISVIDSDGILIRIDMITGGTGYTEIPIVSIGLPAILDDDDRAIASIEFDIAIDVAGDDVILIDVDDETRWITKPDGAACNVAGELWPDAPRRTYNTPNAGYVHLDDIDFQSFSEESIDDLASLSVPPSTHGETIWIARDAREDFAVFYMDNYRASTIATQDETDFDDTAPNGTFFGGTGYVDGEVITLSDGTEVTIDTPGVAGGVVTDFDITRASTSFFAERGNTVLTTASSTASGNNDFTLTIGEANEASGSALITGTGATFTQTPASTDDGKVTFTTIPREDVIEATLTIDVTGVSDGVASVTLIDGGLGYTSAGSFTISSLTHGAERSDNETDAVIDFDVDLSTGAMITPTVTIPGSAYARNVATAVINTSGSGYSLNDVLTIDGGTLGTAATLTVTSLSTVFGDLQSDFTGVGTEGTFAGGTGHATGDIITLTDGSIITVDDATVSTIAQQTHDDYDNSPTTEGTFAGGSDYVVGDLMTMTDGSVVQVTDESSNVVTEFKIVSASTSSILVGNTITVLVLPASGGVNFTMTPDVDNVQATTDFGVVTEFTVTTASTTGITTQTDTIFQTSSDGSGIDFALTLGSTNQGVFGLTITDSGAYLTTLPGTTDVGTSVAPEGGNNATVDLTFIGVGIPVNTADVTDPEGYLRFLGNEIPGSGQIYVDNTVFDYVRISGLDYTLSKDGTAIEDNTFSNSTPFFTLVNLRFRTISERDVFNSALDLMGATRTWTDDNGSGLFQVDTFTAPSTFTALRIETDLIETDKFVNAFVYEADTKDTLAQIPVYDPFKGIIPGNADLNIKYKSVRDPARYTNASVTTLVNEDQAFDGDQVGEIWWDLSTSAYIYYEQDTDVYRRDNWGRLFNGSSIDIYEWTRSTALPSAYTGDGTVRNTTDFTTLEEFDPILEEIRTFFYFWVKDRTEIPGVKNRTIAGFEIANIITNPSANLYQWFSPISQTAFMFSGVDGVFTDSDNIFQINYRRQDDERPTHVEWELGRENDPSYIINTKHFDKMVDSLTGFTAELDIGAAAFLDTTASFLTDATSVITAAPDMIVMNVIATFLTDVTGITAATNQIGTVAVHGLTTGDSVVYSTRFPGIEDVGLDDGRTYFANVLSATTLSLHNLPTDAIGDIDRVVLNTSGAETHALTSAAHGIEDQAAVTYSAAGGTPVPVLVDGREYYAEVITTTSLALHSTRQQAETASPGSRIDLTAAGSPETHTLRQQVRTLHNFNNAIPTAADNTRGYLLVPDPNLSIPNQLGIRIRPLQSMFLNILPARRVFVDKVNELVKDIILRDENPAWEDSLTTTDLWDYVDWFEIGFDATNTIPIRQVTDTSDLASLPDPLDGDIVKVTGTRFSLFEYDIDTDRYTLIGREASRLQLKSSIHTESPSLATALELRELIFALQTEVFINERAINNNLLFFALLNYVFSEQDDIDWAFKTTYIFIDQTGQVLTQNRVFQDDPFDSALEYINEAKPYQTKIRDFRVTRATERDDVNGTASETVRNFTVSLVYDQIRGGDLSITEMRIAKREGTLSTSYRGYSTLDSGTTLVRLGAAGRFVNNRNEELADIAVVSSDNLADYDPAALGPAATSAELEAVAEINAAMTEEFFFDYQGSFLRNTSFGGLPSLLSAVISSGGADYVVGDILELDAGSGVPITAATIRVLTIGGGGDILTFAIVNGGSYQQTPTVDPVLLITVTGIGSGASLTLLVFENGSSVPHDTTPWDQIGFESSVFDESVTTLDGSDDDMITTLPGQTEVDYDGLGGNGTFIGGTGFTNYTTAGFGTNDYTDLSFDSVANTITRNGGTGFVTDGFKIDQKVVVATAVFGDNNGTFTIDTVTETVITIIESITTTDAADSSATLNGFDTIHMDDGTDLTINSAAGGIVTTFTITGGSFGFLSPLATINLLTTSDAGTGLSITLGPANQTSASFADIPAEESFTANGSTREFDITTTVPTFFMFVVVDGVEQTLNVDYFFIGTKLVFIIAPVTTTINNIQLFTYIEAGDLINPQVRAGISEEQVPLDPRENLVVIADTNEVVLTAPGTGYAVGEILTAVGGTRLQETIAAQDETDYDGGAGNGTFVAGSGYIVGEVITLTDGSTITVDTESSGAVATFTITTASIQGFLTATLRAQASTTDVGTGFSITPNNTNNEADFGSPLTLTVATTSSGPPGPIATFTVTTQGDYFTYPTSPFATTADASGINATFTLTTLSFLYHNDMRQDVTFSRNSNTASSTLVTAIGSTDTVIQVVDANLLHSVAPTVENPQIAWIGTERIIYHGGINEARLTIDTDGAGVVSAVTLVSGGSGYTAGGSFTITDSTLEGDDNAIIDFTVTSGAMSSPTINTPGTGYTISQNGITVSAVDVTDPPGPHDIIGVVRATNGTQAQAHSAGARIYDGGVDQDIPTPDVYWVNSVTTSYQSGVATGGLWIYHGNGNVHFGDIVDTTFVSTDSVVVGDTLRVTSAFNPQLQNSYFIKDLIAIGEASIVTIDDAGTGYSAGDNISISDLEAALGPSTTPAVLTVGAVNTDGSISHINVDDRGTGYIAGGTSYTITGAGDGNAQISITTSIEGVVLAQPSNIIDVFGEIAENFGVVWELDRALPGGLIAATTGAAVFLQAEQGNVLPIPAP